MDGITPATVAVIANPHGNVDSSDRRRSLIGGGEDNFIWWFPNVTTKQFLSSFTFWLLIAQLAIFVFAVVFSDGFEAPSLNATFGPTRCALIAAGAKFSPFIVHKYEYWRLISAIFIHSGIITLLISSMLELLLILPVELEYGKPITIFLFFLCGATGYTFSTVANPTSVDTGALGPIMGIVGFRIASTALSWPEMGFLERRRTGALEATCAFVALIVGQSPFVDTYATFAGFVIGCFIGGGYFANLVDAPVQSQRIIMAMAVLASMFVIFVCAFLLGAGRFPLVEQVIWTIICQPPMPDLYFQL